MKSAAQMTEELKRRTNYKAFIIQKADAEAMRKQGVNIDAGSAGTNRAKAKIELKDGEIYTPVPSRDCTLRQNEEFWRPKQPPVPMEAASIQDLARLINNTLIYTTPGAIDMPWDPLIIGGTSVGKLSYYFNQGNLVVGGEKGAPVDSLFKQVADIYSAWIVVNGDMEIGAGVELLPPVRNLFMVVYVAGNLTVDGVISMTGRGANHSGTGNSGGATPAVDILIARDDFILNGVRVSGPVLPAEGAAGAAPRSASKGANTGGSATNGGTGGGGSGQRQLIGTSGGGSAGTCFSGGSGGGAILTGTAESGKPNGGAGGATSRPSCVGGTGNPGGRGTGVGGANGNDGTGGVLFVFCEGELRGSGRIEANGVNAGRPDSSFLAGGGSGGGCAYVFCGANPGDEVPVTARGGSTGHIETGGGGGNGTARKQFMIR